jgi:hypothetical protein
MTLLGLRDPKDPFGHKAKAEKLGGELGKRLADNMIGGFKKVMDDFYKDRAQELQKKQVCMVLVDDGNKTQLYEFPLEKLVHVMTDLNDFGILVESKERFKENEKTDASK